MIYSLFSFLSAYTANLPFLGHFLLYTSTFEVSTVIYTFEHTTILRPNERRILDLIIFSFVGWLSPLHPFHVLVLSD